MLTSRHHKKTLINIKHNLKVYKMSIRLLKIKRKSWKINIFKWKWLWKGWMISKLFSTGFFLIRISLIKRWISSHRRLKDPSCPLMKIYPLQNHSLVFPAGIIGITALNLSLWTTPGRNKLLMMTISGKETLLPILKREITDLFLIFATLNKFTILLLLFFWEYRNIF